MIGKLMRRYALTRQGAIDFIKCTAITTLHNSVPIYKRSNPRKAGLRLI